MKKMHLVFLFALMLVCIPARSYALSDVTGLKTTAELQSQKQEQMKRDCPSDVAKGCECPETIQAPDSTAKAPACITERQKCGEEIVNLSCCVCDIVDKESKHTQAGLGDIGQRGYTRKSCEEACVKKYGTSARAFPDIGAGGFPLPAAGSVAASAGQIQSKIALCFTTAQCKEYSGTFMSSPEYKCPSGQGRCTAPEPAITLTYPIGGITEVQGFRNFIVTLFNYAIRISGVAAAVVFVFGGFQYMFGSAFGDIKSGKERMVNALVGLVILFSTYTILQTINPDTLKLSKLDVFMINKEALFAGAACTDIKSEKPLKLAEAGFSSDPPNTLKPPGDKSLSFAVAQADARCNSEYYVEGFDAGTCRGTACKDAGDGYSCFRCDGKDGVVTECKDRKMGAVCGVNPWYGKVTTEHTIIQGAEILGVCNFAQGAATYGVVNQNVFVISGGKIDIIGSLSKEELAVGIATKSGNTQPYRITLPKDLVSQGTAKCVNGGGFRGIIVGIVYKHYEGSALNKLFEFHDYALVSKDSCNNTNRLAGYADGGLSSQAAENSGVSSFKSGSYKAAYWCNTHLKNGIDSLNSDQNYWSKQEIEEALSGKKPITCNLTFNDATAPSNPGTKYNNKCDESTEIFPK